MSDILGGLSRRTLLTSVGGAGVVMVLGASTPYSIIFERDTGVSTEKFISVKSLITIPKTGTRVSINRSFELRGQAWAGNLNITAVDVSLDHGATWQSTKLGEPKSRYAKQDWSAVLALPHVGYFEVWVRATDNQDLTQPTMTEGWNPQGHLNNMQHRIALFGV